MPNRGVCSVVLLFLSAYHFIGFSVSETSSCQAIPWLHKCEENQYDKMIPPQFLVDGNTTMVKIQIYIESIGNFKAGSMDYDLDVYFVEFWHDQRLTHNYSAQLLFNEKAQLDRIWLPDIYFANSKKAEYNYVTVPNLVLKLQPNGDIRYSIRVHMKVSCHMDLEAYPLDSQMCYLKIITYGSTTDKVLVRWIDDGIAIEASKDIKPTDLKLDTIRWGYCDGAYFNLSFNCLIGEFSLKRNIGYSLLQVYIPTTFIVVLSWISFWIDPASVPGRVGLAVTTLLTLSTQAIAFHYQLPPVSYAKAQDIWFAACILFLFCALVEFALVNMYARRSESAAMKMRSVSRNGKKARRDAVTEHQVEMVCHVGSNGEAHETDVFQIPDDPLSLHGKLLNYRRKVVLIDKWSRWLFPVVFSCFCLCYWCTYLLGYSKPSGRSE